MISYIKSLFKKKQKPFIDVDLMFSISVGEVCQDCECSLELENGGFTGKPTKCKSCKNVYERELKLKKLGI